MKLITSEKIEREKYKYDNENMKVIHIETMLFQGFKLVEESGTSATFERHYILTK